MRSRPKSLLYRAVCLWMLLCTVFAATMGCVAPAGGEDDVAAAAQAVTGQFVWNAGHVASVEPSSLDIRIGLSPVGPAHSAGVVCSINGGSWTGANAVWIKNQPGQWGGQDEIWGVTVPGLKKGDTVRYAVWGDFGSGRIWDNNKSQDFTTVVKDSSPPVFSLVQGYASWPHDLEEVIDQRALSGFRPGEDVIIPGITVNDKHGAVALAQACYTIDGWKTRYCAAGQPLSGVLAGPYGTSSPVSYLQFDLGHFEAGTHVAFYLEAADDSGNRAWLPGNYDNFEFDIKPVATPSVYPTRVRYGSGVATVELRVGPIGANHSAGIAYSTSPAPCGACYNTWQEKGAYWVRNEAGFEVWQVDVPLADTQAIEFAAFAVLGANAPKIWGNNNGHNYVTTPKPWFVSWIGYFESAYWLPIHWTN